MVAEPAIVPNEEGAPHRHHAYFNKFALVAQRLYSPPDCNERRCREQAQTFRANTIGDHWIVCTRHGEQAEFSYQLALRKRA